MGSSSFNDFDMGNSHGLQISYPLLVRLQSYLFLLDCRRSKIGFDSGKYLLFLFVDSFEIDGMEKFLFSIYFSFFPGQFAIFAKHFTGPTYQIKEQQFKRNHESSVSYLGVFI